MPVSGEVLDVVVEESKGVLEHLSGLNDGKTVSFNSGILEDKANEAKQEKISDALARNLASQTNVVASGDVGHRSTSNLADLGQIIDGERTNVSKKIETGPRKGEDKVVATVSIADATTFLDARGRYKTDVELPKTPKEWKYILDSIVGQSRKFPGTDTILHPSSSILETLAQNVPLAIRKQLKFEGKTSDLVVFTPWRNPDALPLLAFALDFITQSAIYYHMGTRGQYDFDKLIRWRLCQADMWGLIEVKGMLKGVMIYDLDYTTLPLMSLFKTGYSFESFNVLKQLEILDENKRPFDVNKLSKKTKRSGAIDEVLRTCSVRFPYMFHQAGFIIDLKSMPRKIVPCVSISLTAFVGSQLKKKNLFVPVLNNNRKITAVNDLVYVCAHTDKVRAINVMSDALKRIDNCLPRERLPVDGYIDPKQVALNANGEVVLPAITSSFANSEINKKPATSIFPKRPMMALIKAVTATAEPTLTCGDKFADPKSNRYDPNFQPLDIEQALFKAGYELITPDILQGSGEFWMTCGVDESVAGSDKTHELVGRSSYEKKTLIINGQEKEFSVLEENEQKAAAFETMKKILGEALGKKGVFITAQMPAKTCMLVNGFMMLLGARWKTLQQAEDTDKDNRLKDDFWFYRDAPRVPYSAFISKL